MNRLRPLVSPWLVWLGVLCLVAMGAVFSGCTKKPAPAPAVPTGADLVASLGRRVTEESEGALTLTEGEVLQVEDETKIPVVIRASLTLRADRACGVWDSSLKMGLPVFTVRNPGVVSNFDREYLRMLAAGESAKYSFRFACFGRPPGPWAFFPGPSENKSEKKSPAK